MTLDVCVRVRWLCVLQMMVHICCMAEKQCDTTEMKAINGGDVCALRN